MSDIPNPGEQPALQGPVIPSRHAPLLIPGSPEHGDAMRMLRGLGDEIRGRIPPDTNRLDPSETVSWTEADRRRLGLPIENGDYSQPDVTQVLPSTSRNTVATGSPELNLPESRLKTGEPIREFLGVGDSFSVSDSEVFPLSDTLLLENVVATIETDSTDQTGAPLRLAVQVLVPWTKEMRVGVYNLVFIDSKGERVSGNWYWQSDQHQELKADWLGVKVSMDVLEGQQYLNFDLNGRPGKPTEPYAVERITLTETDQETIGEVSNASSAVGATAVGSTGVEVEQLEFKPQTTSPIDRIRDEFYAIEKSPVKTVAGAQQLIDNVSQLIRVAGQGLGELSDGEAGSLWSQVKQLSNSLSTIEVSSNAGRESMFEGLSPREVVQLAAGIASRDARQQLDERFLSRLRVWSNRLREQDLAGFPYSSVGNAFEAAGQIIDGFARMKPEFAGYIQRLLQ